MPRVLIVDDHLGIARLTARLFRAEGFEAAFVTSGPEALAMMASGEPAPHVVLLDINMPDMDGLEVLRLIRAGASHSDVPVVMYTALGDEVTRRRAQSLGADGYVVKTCDWEELRREVLLQVAGHDAGTGRRREPVATPARNGEPAR